MILAGQRSMNAFRASWLLTLMTRRGCTGQREGPRENQGNTSSSTSAALSSRSGPPYSASGQLYPRVYSSSQRLGPRFKISSFLYFTR